MTFLWAVAILVVAVSFMDLGIGLLETMAADAFGAVRRLVRRLGGTDRA